MDSKQKKGIKNKAGSSGEKLLTIREHHGNKVFG